METFINKKIIYTAFAIIIALNVATLGAFWLYVDSNKGRSHYRSKRNFKVMLEKKFGFSEEDFIEAVNLKREFFSKIRSVSEREEGKVKRLFLKAIKTNDSKSVDSLMSLTSDHHNKKTIIAINHFKELRKLCKKKNRDAFDEMIFKTVAARFMGIYPKKHFRSDNRHN